MAREYHYILVYNDVRGFYLDLDSSVAGSSGFDVYDTNTSHWTSSVDNAGDLAVDTHLQKAVNILITKLNNREAII